MNRLLFFILSLHCLQATAQQGSRTAKNTSRFTETAINAVSPRGWLQEFLQRQRTGLTGHPEVMSYPYNSLLWAGDIRREDEQHGANWWRYEQTAYYSDGLLRLGYLLNDDKMIRKARAGIAYTLSHVQPNGRLGPTTFTSQWPVAVYFRVLQAEYLVTGNEKIIDALHKHYLSYTPEELGNFKRNIVNIEGALWTYHQTGDPALLELAEKAWELGGFELNKQRILGKDKDSLHGVTYMEMAKLPVILYACSGKKEYLDLALRAMQKLHHDHLLPDGVPSSNEFLAGKDPLQSHETCDITDYTWTLGYFLMTTGDASWADRIERAVFNAGPGAVSKDFKNLQYFSSVNQVIATGNSNHNRFAHGSTWMAYWPCHETECCAGNVHRFMPNYAARMWMKDNRGGIVAALYGPSTYRYNTNCTVTESTDYPFGEEISFVFNMRSSEKINFSFRIPGWCANPALTINNKTYTGPLTPGTFVTLTRNFTNGDKITVHLPMKAALQHWQENGAFVEAGPLLFTYPVPEKVTIDKAAYPNLGNKRSTDPAFPALDIQPAGNWNYALNTVQKDLRLIKKKTTGYPFDPSFVPIKIQVQAHTLGNWKLVEGRYTPPLPATGAPASSVKDTTLTLVPYGSTRLRLTVFPVLQQQQPSTDTAIVWQKENFGANAGGTFTYTGNTMRITTQNTRHGFFQSDAYSFAWKEQPFPYDDCSRLTVTVKVDSVSAGSAGIMMRANKELGAANVHLETSATGDVYLFYRRRDNEPTAYVHMATCSFPVELKLLRQGDFYTAYYKNTKGDWVKGATAMAETGASMLTGLYACSGTLVNEYTRSSFRDWTFHYQENYTPAEQSYTDAMPVKPGTILRDNFNDGSLSNLPETPTNPVWKGIRFAQLPYGQKPERYWRKTGDGQFSFGNKKWADYEVSLDLAFDSASMATSDFTIRLRNQEIAIYNNMARYYAVTLRGGNKLAFEKYGAGGQLFYRNVQLPNYFNGRFHNLKVRLLDTRYEIYYDNKLIIEGNDTLSPLTFGNVSIKFTDAAMKIDNLEVLKIDDPINGEADNFLQDYYNVPLPAYLKKYGL